MSKLLVIVGSTRPTRAPDLVLPWLTKKVKAHEEFDAEIKNLATKFMKNSRFCQFPLIDR